MNGAVGGASLLSRPARSLHVQHAAQTFIHHPGPARRMPSQDRVIRGLPPTDAFLLAPSAPFDKTPEISNAV